MKVTYNQILNAAPALKTLSQKEIPIKQAVQLARLIKKLDSELEVFNEKHRALYEKFGEQDEDGKLSVKTENAQQFSKQFKQLIDVELTVDADRISISSEFNIEASVILATEAFVDFENPV